MRCEHACLPKAFAAVEAAVFAKAWVATDFPNGDEHLYCSFWHENRCLAYAYVRVALDEGELYRIAVLPEYRRQGLARRLMAELISLATGCGVTCLHLEVSQLNEGAVHFYQISGWESVGLRKNYYGPGDAALLMKLTLNPSQL